MKKLIILISIIGILVLANVLFNNKNYSSENVIQSLSELILLEKTLSSFTISKNNNKIKLVKKESCYEIEGINYCADNKKTQLVKKFLSSYVKDVYEKTEDNLKRLGFKSNENISIININDKKSLFFGNINKYNEVYVLHLNKIYKVDYYEGMLETTTKYWIDKSNPLLPVVEDDEFDIEITAIHRHHSNTTCASLKHNEIILTTKHSALRNSFFDLYASDIEPNNVNIHNLKNRRELPNLILLSFNNTHTEKFMHQFYVWKDEQSTYFQETFNNIKQQSSMKFIIPNSVYDNVSSYCKK